jgi:hypothetical protein
MFTVEGYDVHHMVSESDVNAALKHIVSGVVGFDTEFDKRTPTAEEGAIHTAIRLVGGNARTAILAWNVVLEAKYKKKGKKFPVLWDNIALCVVQIAYGKTAWVINLAKMRGAK